jgi:uncharacterized protein (TIGR00730 family)
MFERKADLINEADAFVALPGGLGTLDEILDAITLRQLGYHAKPMLLLDQAGFWQPLHELVGQFVAHGFAAPGAADLYELIADVPGLMARLENLAGGRATPEQ